VAGGSDSSDGEGWEYQPCRPGKFDDAFPRAFEADESAGDDSSAYSVAFERIPFRSGMVPRAGGGSDGISVCSEMSSNADVAISRYASAREAREVAESELRNASQNCGPEISADHNSNRFFEAANVVDGALRFNAAVRWNKQLYQFLDTALKTGKQKKRFMFESTGCVMQAYRIGQYHYNQWRRARDAKQAYILTPGKIDASKNILRQFESDANGPMSQEKASGYFPCKNIFSSSRRTICSNGRRYISCQADCKARTRTMTPSSAKGTWQRANTYSVKDAPLSVTFARQIMDTAPKNKAPGDLRREKANHPEVELEFARVMAVRCLETFFKKKGLQMHLWKKVKHQSSSSAMPYSTTMRK